MIEKCFLSKKHLIDVNWLMKAFNESYLWQIKAYYKIDSLF